MGNLQGALPRAESECTSAQTHANASTHVPVHIFASSDAWIEGTARHQLEQVANLPGMQAVAAMPDLHPGKFGPVGCGLLADRIYPQFIGSDIGCGMGLYELDTTARKLRLDKLAQRLGVLDTPWQDDIAEALESVGLPPTAYDTALGSIGGGNHFCEVQVIDEILDTKAAQIAGIETNKVYVLVHSGSRGLGHSILQHHLTALDTALSLESEQGQAYMAAHDHAVRWAQLNRRIIAERAANAAHAEVRWVTDLPHNMAEIVPAQGKTLVLHRKGAAASDRGLIPVPGSRGTASYLMQATDDAAKEALNCLAHGAGRKYDRSSMHGRVRTKKSDLSRLKQNPFGGTVVCEDRQLLVEEAPNAYKNIEGVIADLIRFGLATVVARFTPLLTFKTAINRSERSEARSRARSTRKKSRREGRQ